MDDRNGASLRKRMNYLLILVSGPPRSGKNRAGVCLAEYLRADHFALSNALKRLTHRHYGLEESLRPQHFENSKDLPSSKFHGLSPRQAYIEFSETVLKPRHGRDYLGRIGASRVMKNRKKGVVSIVSGVGFMDEVMPLIDEAGSRWTLHLRIVNPNPESSSPSDSREELDLDACGVRTVEIHSGDCSCVVGQLSRLIS